VSVKKKFSIIAIMPPDANKTKYQRVLNAFLSRRDGLDYANDTVFADDVIRNIKEEDVVRWLNYKAYGVDEPGEDDLPTHCRSSTLHFHKKSISHFIPNKHFKWNVETLTGNPTMSPGINALVRAVKKHEVRAEGVPSQARRAFLPEEFRLVLRIVERFTSLFELQVRLPTMAKFQVHLIARIDDTSHVKSCDLKVHPQFEFALSVKLRWTKNCLEERDAPEQIILGAMDSDFCLIAALAIYLQYAYEFTNAANSEYLFCDTDETPVTVKTQISGLLTRRVLKSDDWLEYQHNAGNNDDATNNCDTHSYRKLDCTMARLAGRVQDEVDCRGRWRDTQRISDRYTSISLPFIDAHVASGLCVGGPVKYKPKDNSNVTDQWLLTEFVPHLSSNLGNRVGILLGKALLWCLMEPLMMFAIPEHLRTRLKVRYMLVQTLDENENPINRIPLSVYGVGGQLHIDPARSMFVTGDGEGDGGREAAAFPIGDSQQALLSQNHAIRGRVEELFSTVRNNNEALLVRIGKMHRVVQRFANRPTIVNHGFVRRRVGDDDDIDDTDNNINRQHDLYAGTLSKHPKDLFHMWEEYQFGIEGRKAARKFSIKERGRNRFTYNRRKIVWDKISELIREGHSHLTAIDEIYDTYGRDATVTTIINKLRSDRIGARAIGNG
jgi:hypothetical protein